MLIFPVKFTSSFFHIANFGGSTFFEYSAITLLAWGSPLSTFFVFVFFLINLE